jgi:hypothetical protein
MPERRRRSFASQFDSHGPAMNRDRNRQTPVSVHSAVRLLPIKSHSLPGLVAYLRDLAGRSAELAGRGADFYAIPCH